MSRRLKLLIAALVLALGIGGGLYLLRDNDAPRAQTPSTMPSMAGLKGSRAIEAVAWWLDVPLNTTGPNTYQKLNLPENTQELDFYGFEAAWEEAFNRNWNRMLAARNFGSGAWPGDVRFMTSAKGDSPDTGTTTCPKLNNDNREVKPESLSIFYCAADPIRPFRSDDEVAKYERGTLWVPIAELMRLWREVRMGGGMQTTHAQQVTQAAFVHLTASWADALPRQLRALAAEKGAQLPVFERVGRAHEFGYCVAGAMGRTVFGTGDASVITQALPPNFQADRVLEGKITALRLGFHKNSLGACIKAYWPKTDTPN